MPEFYLKDSKGNWTLVESQYVKHPSVGWKRVIQVLEKTNSTTWTSRINNVDITPPGPLTITPSYSNEMLVADMRMPQDADFTSGVVKLMSSGWPSAPDVETRETGWQTFVQDDGTPFSRFTSTPGGRVTKRIPATPGATYYIRGWTKDSSGNWSTAASATFTVPYPTTLEKKLITKSMYINPGNSGSYDRTSGYWRNDQNVKMVYQGGSNHWDGRWFYGDQIKTALANAHEITEMRVYMERVNSAHGVSAAAQTRVGTHTSTFHPGMNSGRPPALVDIVNGPTLTRGEGEWWNLPTAWRAGFKSGTRKGLGLYAGTTSFTSNQYLYCYGAGTASGRIYVKWTEYA